MRAFRELIGMGKKRKAQYFAQQNAEKKAKLKFGNTLKLTPNMKGFLITYNCKFTFCINEAKKLVQQFSLPINEESEKKSDKGCQDLEKLLKEETEEINKRDKEFAVIDTGAKYTIFINVNSIDPNQVVESIFEHIEQTKKPLGRYCQRFLPVINTCKAHLDDIEKCIKATFESIDAVKKSCSTSDETPAQPFKYSCVFKASNNGSIARDEIFKMIGAYMQSKNKLNKVDFDKPDYVILIQVICNMCLISFVSSYFEYKKYNLVEHGNKFTSYNASIAKLEDVKSEANADDTDNNTENENT